MIPYHGSPLNPESAAVSVYSGRHIMVSFDDPRHMALVAEVSQSFCLDNGAYSAWRSGKPIKDWSPFRGWLEEWYRHPAFDWFLIPDVIDADENENDALLPEFRDLPGAVPIWHLQESITRVSRLIEMGFTRIAIGSAGQYADIGNKRWWARMNEAMSAFCDSHGRPLVKIHGLRMLDPQIFRRFPFSSADSTNAARNVNMDSRWKGTYAPMSKAVRGLVLADRIEAYQSAAEWVPMEVNDDIFALVRRGYDDAKV